MGFLGGVAGLLVAVWGSALLTAAFLPDAEQVTLISDARTVAFAMAIALGTGIVIGFVPMSQAQGISLTDSLKSGAREGSYQRARLRRILLVVQTALSVVLLVGAGLFVRSLRNARDVRLGYDPDHVLVIALNNLRVAGLDSGATAALRLRLLDVAKHVPGVSHATLQEATPLAGWSSYSIYVPGIDSASALGEFEVNAVSSEYFATMGTRILRGRGIEGGDTEGARRVAVVGQSMANVLWPGQDPMGRCIRMAEDIAPCTYVVGVSEDIHSHTIETESKAYYYYVAATQWHPEEGGLFVRGEGPVGPLIEPLRRQLQREMPGTSFITVAPLAETVDARLRSWILGATVFTAFGVLALVLAAVGLYTVIAYGVAQRVHEIGVRLALGARRSGIVRLVVLEALRVVFAGIVIGAVIIAGAGHWIAPLLFHVSARDPAVFGTVIVVLLATTAAASCLPALRAAGMDPKAALQSD